MKIFVDEILLKIFTVRSLDLSVLPELCFLAFICN